MPKAGRGGPFLGDFLAVWDGIKSSLPYLEDEATVIVNGNPSARRKDLYFLAAATAFSLVKRFDAIQVVSPPPGMIMLEWDAAGNAVKFTVKYKTNLTSAAAFNGGSTLANIPLFAGPPDEVRGAKWNFTGATVEQPTVIPVIGSGLLGQILLQNSGFTQGTQQKVMLAPDLRKYVGRPILTRNTTCTDPNPLADPNTVVHSPNPRPVGDGRSRGTLYQLVYAALTTPTGAGLKEFSPAPTGTQFSGG